MMLEDAGSGPRVTPIEALEKEYQENLADITSESKEVLYRTFALEYQKLHKALHSSHELEKRLVRRIRDLDAELSTTTMNLEDATKRAEDDDVHIRSLTKVVDSQMQLIEESRQNEQQTKNEIAVLKEEIAELNVKIEKGVQLPSEIDIQVGQFEIQKEQLTRDRDLRLQGVETMLGVCAAHFKKLQKQEELRQTVEEQILQVKLALTNKKTEVEMEKQRKEDLERQMKELRHANELDQEELNTTQRSLRAEEAEVKRIEQEVTESEREEHRLVEKGRSKGEEKRRVHEKLEQEMAKNTKYRQDNDAREQAVKAKREEIKRHQTERDKLVKMHENLRRRTHGLEEEKQELELARDELKMELKATQDEIDKDGVTKEIDRQKMEDLTRERDILDKRVVKADDKVKVQLDLVKRQETEAVNIQKDIMRWKQEAQKFKKRIWDLEKQRERYGIELSQANAKYFAELEELRTREAILTELKKKIADIERRGDVDKSFCEKICKERKMAGKTLQELDRNQAETKRNLLHLFDDTTNLKMEIREKSKQLMDAHFRSISVQDTNKGLKKANKKATKRMKNLVDLVETQKTEIKKLENTIQDAQQERQRQQMELDRVIGERDILGAQLIRRNEELGLLYEKIKIQQATLQKGEVQYREHVKEMNDIRDRIRETTQEVGKAMAEVEVVQTFEREINQLKRNLIKEETKAEAIQRELDNPMNVHRWHELKGLDPETHAMIEKVRSLQKLLIAKTEEVVEKDALIQEKEKHYVQLKNVIARQPGPEVAEQLSWYGEHLKEKTQHMKQMASQLKEYHTKTKDLKDEIDRHRNDLRSTKQMYFQKKRRELLSQEQNSRSI